MSTKFCGEGNIGAVEKRIISQGNEPPKVVVSLNIMYDNSVKSKKTGEYEDLGGFWAPTEFWPKDIQTADHLITKILLVGMRVKVEGQLVQEKFTDKQTNVERTLMKVRTTMNGVSLCLTRIDQVIIAHPKRNGNEPNQQPQQSSINNFEDDSEPF